MGEDSVCTLATTGISASSGSRRRTWFTLACTSLKATSTSLSRSKVTLMTDTPGLEKDCTCWMPGMPLISLSSTEVTLVSTISGLAPGSAVVTETMGNSTRG